MPQTKRKRRTKHRGNAAGSIETRGRTGRKPRPEEVRATAARAASTRPVRGANPPSWKSAAGKALFGAAMLFAAMKLGVLGGEKKSTAEILPFVLMAAVLYTPVMYATDSFIYKRKQKALAPAAPKKP